MVSSAHRHSLPLKRLKRRLGYHRAFRRFYVFRVCFWLPPNPPFPAFVYTPKSVPSYCGGTWLINAIKTSSFLPLRFYLIRRGWPQELDEIYFSLYPSHTIFLLPLDETSVRQPVSSFHHKTDIHTYIPYPTVLKNKSYLTQPRWAII